MRSCGEGWAREKVLVQLKANGPQTAAQLAERLGVTPMAIRQHLSVLDEEGLVTFQDRRGSVGRPARVWHLRPAAEYLFPDGHDALNVGLLKALRTAFGQEGVQTLLHVWTQQQQEQYAECMPPLKAPLERRVATLTDLRSKEGYMACYLREKGGTFLFVENHCAVHAAARECKSFCACELDLIRSLLGPRVTVERVEHILNGQRRCAYRVTPEAQKKPSAKAKSRK